MLTEPNLDVMIQRPDQGIHNKFELIILATKRARQLNEGSPCLVKTKARKAVSIALHEVYQEKIKKIVATSDTDSKPVIMSQADSEAAALAEALGNQ